MTSRSHRTRGLSPSLTPWVAVITGVLACVVAARSTGAMDPLVFVEDAGPLVRWSVPIVRVGHDVAAAVTLGALVFAASLVPDAGPTRRGGRAGDSGPDVSATTAPAMRLATIAGVVWTLTALAGVVLTFADAAGLPLTSPALGAQLTSLVWQIDATRVGLISAACALVVTSGAALARSRVTAAWLAALAAAGIVVLGLASHTGTSDDHETSVNAMGLHLIGATMWVGGLIVLVTLHRTFARTLAVVAARYSTLALWSYVAVGASGVIATTTRLGAWSDLGTPYGLLIVAKVVLFVVLGAAGWWHRRSTIAELGAGVRGRPFLRLAVAEVALMGMAFGIATALSRSAPPVPEDFPDPTPTLQITGFPAPPDPATTAWWEVWRADWLVLVAVVVALGLYAGGVVAARLASAQALRASRDAPEAAAAGREPGAVSTAAELRWPRRRTASWVLGWLLLAWVTGGPMGVYARVSISWHLALQLVLVFVVAPLIVAGSPVTLAERALAARDDGTLGPRELVLGVVRSRAALRLRRPVVATVLLLVTLVLLTATGMLELALTTHPGHLTMLGGSLLIGIVWSAAILAPTEAAPRQALICLGVVVAAAFAAALWLARTSVLLAGDVFARLDLPWLTALAAEQARAGAVALFVVVPACAVLALVVSLRSRVREP
ncbi:putative copper resistance protein D [Humibacillus xanthopallidus]|uniref:Putative copper resistance protein D n=1 Tax=Humibacillus xanthopallidus TaxID=412689 RepID=A0A543PNK6_9MICO|nr:cytochrome c oxidase assembly protein [Humibacillus xanthopallidus]TQN45666.1 putative copper resistance protein D [Humibacillus xanthopallidus]